MQKNHWVSASILAMGLLAGGGMMFSRAAEGGKEARTGMDAVASVNMEKIFASSDAPKVLAEASLNFERQATDQIRAIAGVPYLTPAEVSEFAQSVAVAAPTEAQKARSKELKALSDSRSKQVQELSAKKGLTPEEQKFLTDMAQRERNLQQSLVRVQQDMQGNEAQLMQTLRRQQMEKLSDMVKKTATDKGFTHVFDSSSLVYSVNDVTAAIIQKMPKSDKN